MSNPNFVSELVLMAKAMEELPIVQQELHDVKASYSDALDRIQRLELRLIDASNEIASAHEASRKMEVERDHAERMFLETDDRLNAFRRLLAGFQSEAGALVAAAEPEAKPEPEDDFGAKLSEPMPEVKFDDGGPYNEPLTAPITGESAADPTPAQAGPIGTGTESVQSSSDTAPEVALQPDPTLATESSSESVSQGSQGESAVDPILQQSAWRCIHG